MTIGDCQGTPVRGASGQNPTLGAPCRTLAQLAEICQTGRTQSLDFIHQLDGAVLQSSEGFPVYNVIQLRLSRHGGNAIGIVEPHIGTAVVAKRRHKRGLLFRPSH